MNPWPGAYFIHRDQRIKVIKADVVEELKLGIGETDVYHKFPVIGTSKGVLVCVEIQPEGKRIMSGVQYLAGARNWISKTNP